MDCTSKSAQKPFTNLQKKRSDESKHILCSLSFIKRFVTATLLLLGGRGRRRRAGGEGHSREREATGEQRPRTYPHSGYQRGAEGAGSHVHDAPEVRQAADEAGHPEHGRRGDHDAGTAGARAQSESEGGVPEATRGGEGRGRPQAKCPASHDTAAAAGGRCAREQLSQPANATCAAGADH